MNLCLSHESGIVSISENLQSDSALLLIGGIRYFQSNAGVIDAGWERW